jgi:hypothetical protein
VWDRLKKCRTNFTVWLNFTSQKISTFLKIYECASSTVWGILVLKIVCCLLKFKLTENPVFLFAKSSKLIGASILSLGTSVLLFLAAGGKRCSQALSVSRITHLLDCVKIDIIRHRLNIILFFFF